jgi:hypothetical protein
LEVRIGSNALVLFNLCIVINYRFLIISIGKVVEDIVPLKENYFMWGYILHHNNILEKISWNMQHLGVEDRKII